MPFAVYYLIPEIATDVEGVQSPCCDELSWDGMIDNFLVLLSEAHQMRVDHPRYPIAQVMVEIVSGAISAHRECLVGATTRTMEKNLKAQVKELMAGNAWLVSQPMPGRRSRVSMKRYLGLPN